MRRSSRPIEMFSAVGVLALGLLLAAPTPLPAKTHLDLGLGIQIGDLGSGSWLGLSYGRHSRSGTSWGISLGLASPSYVYAPPPAPVYEYRPYVYPRYYPVYSPSWYRRYHHPAPYVRPAYRPAPPAVVYDPPAYRTGGAVTVTGGYHRGGSSVAVGVTVPLGSRHTYRPSQRAVRVGSVERNPIMKRVWVPGHYVTTRAPNSSQATSSGSGDKVWVEGYWNYVPDTQ